MRRFGELEAVIMDRLWERGRPALVREMVEDLREDRALAYTTVMTVMDNLYRKGWLRRGRARWPDRAPLLAILTYLAAGWSAVAALGLAGLTLAVHATALGGGLSHLIGACVLRLRATYGTPGGVTVAALGLSLAGAV